MKLLFTLILSLFLVGVVISAEPAPKVTPTIKSELKTFFTSKDWIAVESQSASCGPRVLKAISVKLQALLQNLPAKSQDTPEDKRLLQEMKKTGDAITKAQGDKTQWGEAWRAVTSLKSAALR